MMRSRGWFWLGLLLCGLGEMLWCAASGRAGGWPDLAAHFRKPFAGQHLQLLPYRYALLREGPEPVFRSPAAAAPVRMLPAGFVGLSLEKPQPVKVGGRAWYQINPGEYVRAEALELLEPSRFQGVLVPQGMTTPFAWLVFDTRPSLAPGAPPDPAAPLLVERSLVLIQDIRRAGDGKRWCRISGGWWVAYSRVGVVRPRDKPPVGVGARERWIEINLFEQTLAAYEGGRLVFATLISSGSPANPTLPGLFRIRRKVRLGKMSSGPIAKNYYYLEDVPWQMFYDGAYAIHASYWHNLFGLYSSHGCVNVAPLDARWLFDWTAPRPARGENVVWATKSDPGTWVWIHNGGKKGE